MFILNPPFFIGFHRKNHPLFEHFQDTGAGRRPRGGSLCHGGFEGGRGLAVWPVPRGGRRAGAAVRPDGSSIDQHLLDFCGFVGFSG